MVRAPKQERGFSLSTLRGELTSLVSFLMTPSQESRLVRGLVSLLLSLAILDFHLFCWATGDFAFNQANQFAIVEKEK